MARFEGAASPAESDRLFHPFLRLPYELRIAIWEAARPGQRLVCLRIENFRVWIGVPTCAEDVEKTDYYMFGTGGCELTGLLGATRESRQTTLAHYRTQIWLRPALGSSFIRPAYISPETDIVLFKGDLLHGLFDLEQQGLAWRFVRCVKGLYVNDPKRVGLVNLAVDSDTVQALLSLGTHRLPTYSGGDELNVFRRVLSSSLRRVYLMCPTASGGQHTPLLPRHLLDAGGTLPIAAIRNHVSSSSSSSLSADEEEGAAAWNELRSLDTGSAAQIDAWRHLERVWRLQQTPPVTAADSKGWKGPECYLAYAGVAEKSHNGGSVYATPEPGTSVRDVYRDEVLRARTALSLSALRTQDDHDECRQNSTMQTRTTTAAETCFWVFGESDLRPAAQAEWTAGQKNGCGPLKGVVDLGYKTGLDCVPGGEEWERRHGEPLQRYGKDSMGYLAIER